MNRFARLLDDLLLSPSRTAKLGLLREYFAAVPDPDRGWALATLTGGLDFRHAKPAAIRALAVSRVDPVLFALSYDYVGDLAETTALIWPAPAAGIVRLSNNSPPAPALAEIVDALAAASRSEVETLLGGWLDRLDADGRFALLKLVTGGLRVGVSARLAKTALAELGAIDVAKIEEIWHGLAPPYASLFAWLEGSGPAPAVDEALAFRPLMLAHALEQADLATLDARDFRAEWKWDGIRVQLVARAGAIRLYSRGGDEIGDAFPEIREAAAFDATLDGELLVRGGDDGVAPFNDLQRRLNRKQADAGARARFPAFVRLYDLLIDAGADLRALPFAERRARLEAWFASHVRDRPAAARFDLSPALAFDGWDDLARLRLDSPALGAEGLMLKRADSPYLAGRPRGAWFKWKREPRVVDAVLMYAERGHGKRSSFYSDFTFGCWRGRPDAGGELVPVGKAYFGFTDAELARLDRWVRAHTVERFGPVRAVERALVCELAFDAVQRSSRHKSGVALRFPRIARIRWDKPAAEADAVETLERMIP